MTSLHTPLGRFRLISLVEGISYIVLMGIAMPLKYLAGNSEAVRVVGSIHGGLFVLFALALLHVSISERWPRRASATAMIAALLPLGAFWLEHGFRRGTFPPRPS
ncbi:MAG: YdzA [Myxococcales bacterium]|nr:YdzA [Myxococcales bacterium]